MIQPRLKNGNKDIDIEWPLMFKVIAGLIPTILSLLLAGVIGLVRQQAQLATDFKVFSERMHNFMAVAEREHKDHDLFLRTSEYLLMEQSLQKDLSSLRERLAKVESKVD